jgi:ABC-type glycerol-3-phosphate transport system permease component
MATIASMTKPGEQAARNRKLILNTISMVSLTLFTLIWLLPVFASLITSFRTMKRGNRPTCANTCSTASLSPFPR